MPASWLDPGRPCRLAKRTLKDEGVAIGKDIDSNRWKEPRARASRVSVPRRPLGKRKQHKAQCHVMISISRRARANRSMWITADASTRPLPSVFFYVRPPARSSITSHSTNRRATRGLRVGGAQPEADPTSLRGYRAVAPPCANRAGKRLCQTDRPGSPPRAGHGIVRWRWSMESCRTEAYSEKMYRVYVRMSDFVRIIRAISPWADPVGALAGFGICMGTTAHVRYNA